MSVLSSTDSEAVLSPTDFEAGPNSKELDVKQQVKTRKHITILSISLIIVVVVVLVITLVLKLWWEPRNNKQSPTVMNTLEPTMLPTNSPKRQLLVTTSEVSFKT